MNDYGRSKKNADNPNFSTDIFIFSTKRVDFQHKFNIIDAKIACNVVFK